MKLSRLISAPLQVIAFAFGWIYLFLILIILVINFGTNEGVKRFDLISSVIKKATSK